MNNLWERIKYNVENSRFFSRNTTSKMISIFFALIMWLYVMGEVNPQSMIELENVAVQLINVEDITQSGLMVMGQKDFTVNVKISGRRNDVYKITPQDIVARADLRGFQKGVNSVPVEISTPVNTRIADISPKQIKITLDEIIKAQKPVTVQPVGTAAEGFEPGEASVSPNEVIVEGPESLVNRVTMALADVNVKDKNEDITGKLPLKAVNSKGKEVNGVEVRNKYVEVMLPMYRVKEVPIVVNYQGEAKEGFKIANVSPNLASILIKGPKEIVNAITEIKTKPLNLDGLDKTTQKDMEFILQEGIEAPYLDIKPVANITVEKVKDKEFTFKRDEVSVENLESGLVIDWGKLPENIKVRVEGIESVLDTVEKGDIKIFINAKNLSEGKHAATLSYTITKKVEQVTIIPENVDLQIKSGEAQQ